MLTLCILSNENEIKKNSAPIKYFFYSAFILISLIHINWSIKAISSEIKNEYSASKTIYEFILENNLNKYKIDGLGYKSVAVQPYFPKNIYNNYLTSHFMFSRQFEKFSSERIKELAPVIIYDYSWNKKYEHLEKQFDNDYYAFPFYNNFCCNGNIDNSTDLYVLIKKDINYQESGN